MKYELGRYNNMNIYKVWSKDLGFNTFEEGHNIKAFGPDDAVDGWLEEHWHDCDCPEPPIKFSVQEIDNTEMAVGEVFKFELESIDYLPQFNIYLDDSETKA